MSGAYAGETEAKKLARAAVYFETLVHAFQAKLPVGDVVSLAGPTCAEGPILTEIAKYTGGRVAVADVDAAAVEAARSSGVHAHHGDVRELLDQMRRDGRCVAFAHLDFMGHATAVVEETARYLARILADGGVVAYTLLRGREMAGREGWEAAKRRADAIRNATQRGTERQGSPILQGLDDARLFGNAERLCEWLGDSRMNAQFKTYLVGFVRYHSGRSPMATIVLQRRRRGEVSLAEINRIYPNVLQDVRPGASVRELALDMIATRTGLLGDPDFIAKLFCIDRAQLAAWRAVETRRNNVRSVNYTPDREDGHA